MGNTSEHRMLKKAAVLSLSLLLISHTSISSILPTMYQYYSDKTVSQVDLIISIPSFLIISVMLLNVVKNGFMSERKLIVTGLLCVAIGGMAPMLCQSYYYMLASRIVLGIGVGLLNIRAIAMVSERYSGDEKAVLLGYRSAMETVGKAAMILMVGRLLLTGWTHVFAVYAAALLILVFYLTAMKGDYGMAAGRDRNTPKVKFSAEAKKSALGLAVFGWFGVSVSSVCSMRVPVLIVEKGYGTETQASVVMSMLMLVGILSGILFGRMLKVFGKRLLTIILFACGTGMVLIAAANNLIVCGIGGLLVGFCYTTMMSVMFLKISERVPAEVLDPATTVVLLGCNAGAALMPYILKAIALIGSSAMIPFFVFAALLFAYGACTLLRK